MKFRLLALLIVLTMNGIVYAEDIPLSGSGTEADPYRIESIKDFNVFAYHRYSNTYWSEGVYTKLMCDIDLSEKGTGYSPIGTSDYNSYSGLFDGNNHIITNLHFIGYDYGGVFGDISAESTVKNLGVKNAKVGAIYNSSHEYIGGLAGKNNGIIMNCYAIGTASGEKDSGGLVGENNGTIINCYAIGKVSGEIHTGGLVGENNGTVESCFACCDVSGSWVGGLVGTNNNIINNSYSIGTVEGDLYHNGKLFAGGLLGQNYGAISYCYSASRIKGSDPQIKNCLIGNIADNSTATGCFWDKEKSDDDIMGGEGGQTTAEMKKINTYIDAGWDFSDDDSPAIWKNVPGYYPRLVWEETSNLLTGWGTEEQPYQISDLADFDVFINPEFNVVYWYNNIHVKLICDLDLSGREFTQAPIGGGEMSETFHNFSGTEYEGIFDGGNNVINNLQVIGDSYLGLFGRISETSVIKNLGVENVYVIGTDFYNGGLVGNNNGKIIKCHTTGTVEGGESGTGGLVGQNWITFVFANNGEIKNCYSTCDVSGISAVGGLVGHNFASIKNCYATGNIEGAHSCGGLIGDNNGPLINSYATGDVTGDWVGGLVGDIRHQCTIENCYAMGKVTGGPEIGGLIGYRKIGVIQNCFWDIETSGYAVGIGYDTINTDSAIGKTTAEMQMLSTYSDAGWGFVGTSNNEDNDIWRMPYAMPGYPILAWEKDIPGDIAGEYGVDMEDAGELADRWMDSYEIADLEILANNWLAGK